MRSLRKSADEYGFPLVIDEIQSGMGRCGTFLASEQSGVRGDYYLLSKALGGGLAKISALLVDRQHYREEFGYLHTSTFADDDYSSFIALGAMELLDRNGGELIDQCKRKGDALLRRLRSLQAKFPKQIAEVRGEGLMIGIELAPQNESASPLVRVLSEQKVISYLACGYLLAQHGIRMAPTLSEQAVLRVEPSAYISDDACERLYAGLGDFLTHLSAGNIQQLVGFMVGRSGATPAPPAESHASAPAGKGLIKPDNRKRRVAFLVHFTTTTDLRNWEPGLSSFSEAECATFLERTEGLLHPFVTHETEITSATGETIRLVVIGVPFTAAQAIESMRDGSDWCLGMVREGLQLARELECNVVGLGGHTSIVCDSGRDLVEDEIVLTSGNSLTVAVIQDVLLHTVERVGLQPERCRLGVVGAAGNVGATVAELISEKAGRIVLIGRRGAERFLQPVAERLYTAAFERLVAGQIDGGIAKVMMRSQIVQKMLGNGRIVSGDTGEKIYFGLVKEMGTAAPIQISQSMEELQTCEIIVSATNAPQSVVNASHIGDGPVVVCDVAVPQDVDPLLISQRPNATVIRGGMLRAPLGQSLGIPGMGLRSGELYACLAETILLGFVGASNHYSYGPLSVQRVRQIREWAWMHGFETFDSRIEQRQ
jgi:predicted amino acid dehydrogenase